MVLNSRKGNFFGDQDVELVAVISSRLPVFSFNCVVVRLDQLLPMKLVGCIHDFDFAADNLWIVLVARAKF